jgi:hypothetical protein
MKKLILILFKKTISRYKLTIRKNQNTISIDKNYLIILQKF